MRVQFQSVTAAVVASLAGSAYAQITVDPFYAANYSVVSLGAVPGVPPSYGGVEISPAATGTLLISGGANGGSGAIYAIQLVRDGTNQIVGFSGTATQVSTAPFNDGGLDYGPLNILFFTTYSNNTIGQIKPGSTTPDRIISMTELGVGPSTGTLAFVPSGFPGEGRLKVASYSQGFWYDVPFAFDPPTGTFNLQQASTGIQIGGGPEGIVFVPPTSPQFSTRSILVSEYGTGRVVSYEIDSNGDPIVATRRVFISGLSGAEGATLDPVTGQFIFSTFGGGSQVVIVRGFAPPPACYVNCDNSTTPPVANIADFTCFASRFASGDTYANCDGSTGQPILNVADFICFLNRYAAGCS